MEIRVEHASKILHGVTILDDISVIMHSGNIYGFQGANGSGKTMLMRLITGLIKPTTGHIFIDGKSLGKSLEFPENTGLLLENPAFLESYTGLQNLILLAGLTKYIDAKHIRTSLLRVGLKPDDQRKYRKYSLGMKQKLGIAAAIMEQPDLLILDEPLNALDPESVSKVKQIIVEEKERGALIIIACHDQQILEELADSIFTIKGGRLTKKY